MSEWYAFPSGVVAKTRRICNIELHIARKRDKLNNHFKKWEKLISASVFPCVHQFLETDIVRFNCDKMLKYCIAI